MAPDLNSVPASPRVASGTSAAPTSGPAPTTSTPASRRASQIFPMSPPPLPLASPGGVIPSSAHGVHHYGASAPLSPNLTGGSISSSTDNLVPMRHPHPMTAAELHLELEKEQEAVVNRLTRELSALRAHTASVASTTSSTTSGAPGLIDSSDPSLVGPTHPTSSRRHRSSSSVSRTSHTATGGYAGIPLTSTTASIPHTHHRYSISSQPGGTIDGQPSSRTPSMGLSTPRYEEVAHYKQELDDAKRENEMLRRRIQELEKELRSPRYTGHESSSRGRTGRDDESETTAGAES